MKKVGKVGFLAVALAAVCVSFFGCGKTTYDRVKDNMSESTSVFYYAEGNKFYASLSCGKRENPYMLNGKSEKNVDFALLSVTLNDPLNANLIKVNVKIGEESSVQELEVNGIHSCYMVDLERKFSGEETVTLEYGGETLDLENLSKDFVVDEKKAIEIGTKALEDKILSCKQGNTLNAECYLRVLDRKGNSFDGVFWCFMVVNVKGEDYSAIISTVDGKVLAKS